MPPRNANQDKKKPNLNLANIVRQPISESSLVFVPSDALEGFRERLYECVQWTTLGAAIRHHQAHCRTEDLPPVSFSDAMKTKINNSILNGFLKEDSKLTLAEQWNVIVPMILWDNEMKGSPEAQICFRNNNNIIDNLLLTVKNAVTQNNRNVIKRALRDTFVLRLTNCGMTYLDNSLKKHKNLVTLNLCGNYLSELDCEMLPSSLRVLEMQANGFSNLDSLKKLPFNLMYIGLAKNLLTDGDGLLGLLHFPYVLTVLDLADNDIYHLEPLLDILDHLPNLNSLQLIGNPCSLCVSYALTTVTRLKRLIYLDNRKILSEDRAIDTYEPHPDDLRSTAFIFNVLRIMSCPIPPKTEKGTTGSFFIQMELPLLDSYRRNYLMYHRRESLVEQLSLYEEDYMEEQSKNNSYSKFNKQLLGEGGEMEETIETNIYDGLAPKDPYSRTHYTLFETSRVQGSKIMIFPEPGVRIFCPDLLALRDTFRSVITVKLVYMLVTPMKKPDKKGQPMTKHAPPEQYVTVASIKCPLRNVDWSQPNQHFHWDSSLGTDEAINWGDGDLSVLQYQPTATKDKVKTGKGKMEENTKIQKIPEIFTCQFSFGIVTISS